MGANRYSEVYGPPNFDWPKAKETKVAIHADHSGITQLNDSLGSAYYQIRPEIQGPVNGAPNVMKRRKVNELAAQDTLGLLFMLQYEYSWLRAWLSQASGQLPPHESSADIIEDENDLQFLSKIPCGHPAYPIVTNISLLITMLSALVTKYRLQSGPESALTSSQPQMSVVELLLPIQISFRLQSYSLLVRRLITEGRTRKGAVMPMYTT